MPIRNPRRPDFHRASSFPQAPVAPSLYRNIAFTFFGLTIVVVGVVVWMSSVKATVRVRVERDVTHVETSVDIAKNPEQGQLQGRVVEGTFDNIQEFKVKEQSATPVVATTTGRVRITNRYSQAQPLIKTTRLLTSDGKLFRINATVNVPSGGTVEVDAYSDKPGNESLIKTGTTFTIPGLWIDLQKLITAEAITSFSGTLGTARVVGATDIADAQTSLENAIVEQAKKTLAAEAGIQPERLATDCPETETCWEGVYLITTMDKKTNVTSGQQSDTFLAQVKVKITAVFYPKKDMELLVRTKLKERLPGGRDLVNFKTDDVVYRLEQTDASAERARIAFTADASSRLTAQSPALSKEAIAGLTVEEAQKKLSAVDGVEFVEVTLRPSWARSIPSQKDKIEINIE